MSASASCLRCSTLFLPQPRCPLHPQASRRPPPVALRGTCLPPPSRPPPLASPSRAPGSRAESALIAPPASSPACSPARLDASPRTPRAVPVTRLPPRHPRAADASLSACRALQPVHRPERARPGCLSPPASAVPARSPSASCGSVRSLVSGPWSGQLVGSWFSILVYYVICGAGEGGGAGAWTGGYALARSAQVGPRSSAWRGSRPVQPGTSGLPQPLCPGLRPLRRV